MNRRTPGFLFNVYPAWGEFYEYRMNPSEFRDEMEKAGFEGSVRTGSAWYEIVPEQPTGPAAH